MNCINHPETIAGGVCNFCGKALCVGCVSRFSLLACLPCLVNHNSNVAKRLLFDIGLTILLFIGVATFTFYHQSTTKIDFPIILGLFISCAYRGWKFLSRFSVLLLFTGRGFMLYLVIKAILSICVGFIVIPWQVFTKIKELMQINVSKKDIEEGRA